MDVHLPTELEAKLARLAAHQGLDSSSLVVEAVERMVDYDAWFLAEVEKGLAEAESGQTRAHEEVGAQMESYLATKRSQL